MHAVVKAILKSTTVAAASLAVESPLTFIYSNLIDSSLAHATKYIAMPCILSIVPCGRLSSMRGLSTEQKPQLALATGCLSKLRDRRATQR